MKTFFVAPVTENVDLAAAAAALREALEAQNVKATPFQPFTGGGLTLKHAEHRLATGEGDDLMEQVVTLARAGGADVLVAEGTAPEGRSYAARLNADLSRSLEAAAVLVADASGRDAAALARALNIAARDYRRSNGRGVAGVLLTAGADAQALKAELGDALPVLGVVGGDLDVSGLTGGEAGERRMPPSAFRVELIERAKAANKRIVLPEGDEPRTVEAAIRCAEKGIARPVLLAKREGVERVAKERGLSVPGGLEIVDPETVREQYVAPMVELRKSKGLTAEQAQEQLSDTVVLGTMMLAQGDVDGLVSGAVHTTANTIRPAFQLIRTAPGSSLVSSVFFMLMPEQVLVYGDAAVNPKPSAEDLAEIAIQSADSAKAFGLNPRVAMLSYSTGTSGSGEDVEKVKQATDLVRERRPDILVDGPLQYDAATVADVARSKAPNSQVAGQANVLIFPDLNAGNIGYKAVQRSAGVVAVGPMLQGLNKPVNDLSRGALVDDIVYTIALTAIQAEQR